MPGITHEAVARAAGTRVTHRRLSTVLTLVLSIASLAAAGYLYVVGAAPASACSTSIGGRVTGRGLELAQTSAGPWYDGDMPALSDQIPRVTRRLFPGVSGSMFVYAKNTGIGAADPSISFADLVDGGGAYTEPERDVEPRRDTGDLSANVVLTLSYSSSTHPSDPPRVVARGTARDLAARGRVFGAPMSLQPFSARAKEMGIWRIDLSVPTAADNRIQGDTAALTVVFGLTQSH